MLFFYRWIRYEEAVEEGGKRWSKPHVASLMMEALQDLQSMLSTCPFILDCTAMSMLDVAGGCLSDFDWCIVVLFSLWQSVHIHYRNKAEWMKHAFKRIRIGITLGFLQILYPFYCLDTRRFQDGLMELTASPITFIFAWTHTCHSIIKPSAAERIQPFLKDVRS